jgi:hypothetical protein
MRIGSIIAILIATLPAAATAQRDATSTLTARGYSVPAPRAVQPVVPDPDQTVCLRDADTRQVICHTYAQWKMIYVERAARKNFDK